MPSEEHITRSYQSCKNSYKILIKRYEVKIAPGRIGEDMMFTFPLYVCILSVCLCMATLTEVFLCFLLSCKGNARIKPAKTGHGPHSS